MKRNKKVAIEAAAPVVPAVRRDEDGFEVVDQPVPTLLVGPASVLDTVKQVAKQIIENGSSEWITVRFEEFPTREGRYFGAMVTGYPNHFDKGARCQVQFGFVQTRHVTKSQRDKWGADTQGGEGSKFYQFHDEVRLEIRATPSGFGIDTLVLTHEGISTYAGGTVRDSMEGVNYFVRSAIAAGVVAEMLPANKKQIEL
jgi:hypothetical protein